MKTKIKHNLIKALMLISMVPIALAEAPVNYDKKNAQYLEIYLQDINQNDLITPAINLGILKDGKCEIIMPFMVQKGLPIGKGTYNTGITGNEIWSSTKSKDLNCAQNVIYLGNEIIDQSPIYTMKYISPESGRLLDSDYYWGELDYRKTITLKDGKSMKIVIINSHLINNR